VKNLRHLFAATVLTLALALSSFAGDVQFPGVNATSTDEQSSGETQFPGATAAGDILTPGLTALDPATEAALGLIRSLLALF
jgi:hypothetical protein